jgi:hypothetical protein
MAVAVFVRQDPSVDQAGQVGPSVKPADGAMPVPQEREGTFASGGGHHLKAARPQMPREALAEGRVGVHDEDALVGSSR